MTLSIQEFYDRLAGEYHLIFGSWDEAVKWQGEVLDTLLRSETGRGSLSILDCSCGIGTQAIGLALLGHRLTATDLSPRSVERAKQEAKRFGVEIDFGTADFRTLEGSVEGTFDAVISCDNALPHMMSRDDLLLAARSIRWKVREGGLFLASIRNYDELLALMTTLARTTLEATIAEANESSTTTPPATTRRPPPRRPPQLHREQARTM